MVKEGFVTYEQAKLLNKLGFNNWDVYIYAHGKITISFIFSYDYTQREEHYPAPTLSEAQAWLRNEKKLFVLVDMLPVTSGKSKFFWYVNDEKGWVIKDEHSSQAIYDTYEEALTEGITDCIKILKNEEE